MEGILKQRSDVVLFIKVPDDTTGGFTIRRGTGFTTLTQNSNPREYSRQYVDEKFEQTDVVGYTANYDFEFDCYIGGAVSDYLAEIVDNEMIGTAAVITTVSIDMTKDPTKEANAIERDYAVIASSVGASLDAMTYAGTLTAKGDRIPGRATVSADGLTAQFVREGATTAP